MAQKGGMQGQMMGGKGMMPGMQQGGPQMMGGKGGGGQQMMQAQQRPPMAQQPPQQQQAPTGMPGQGGPVTDPSAPLTAAALASAPPGMQKQMLGEKLFPLVAKHQPELAGKITGMMLEMDNSELLLLLESDAQMKVKVEEAMRVLEQTK